jgi:hypothetical protein
LLYKKFSQYSKIVKDIDPTSKMSIEASSSSSSVAVRQSENGIRIQNEDQTWDEASALLPKSAIDEVEEEAEEAWSPQSLGPGFIWIQAGWTGHPFHPIFGP